VSTRKSKSGNAETRTRSKRNGKGVILVSLALVVAAFACISIFELEKTSLNGPSEDAGSLGSFDPTAGTIDLSTITAGSYNGYSYNAGTITFTQGADGLSYLITQSNSSAVSMNIVFAFPSGVSTTAAISGINITGNISLQGSATLDLLLEGTNSIAGSILVPSGTAITIDSTDSGTSNGSVTVTASTASSLHNAGIGGSAGSAAGTITINGGTVTATGGNNGAGIGGGSSGDGGVITITGGTVNATGGGWGGAGIGGGSGDPSGARSGAGGTITITGGTVNATGNSSSSSGYIYNVGGGAGIGGAGANNNSGSAPWAASGDSGNITISGSAVVTATGGTGGAYYGAGGAGIGSGGAGGNNSGSTVGLAGVSASTVLDINADVTAIGGPGSSGDGVLKGANIGFGGGYYSGSNLVDSNSGREMLPAAPTNLRTTPLDNGQVSLAWDAGGTDYLIVLNGAMIDHVSSNSYTTDVSVGTNIFTVRATNSQTTVIGSQSNIVTVYGITLDVTGDGTVDVSFTSQGGTPITFQDTSGVVAADVTQVTFTATANPGSVLLNIAQNSGTPATASPQTYTIAGGDTISVLFGSKDYAYEITGDTISGFTVTGYADSGSGTYTPGNPPFNIQAAIDAIKADANGNDCTITFGDGTALNISSNNITFDPAASPGWGSVTLFGGLTSTYNGTDGVITMTGTVNVSSGVTITSASAPAIDNNGTGTLVITGGSLQNTGSGVVISNTGGGNVTITDAVISASGTTAIDMSAGTLSLGGDPTIVGTISVPAGMLTVITSGDDGFAPGGTYSVSISSGSGNNATVVSAGTGFFDNFVLTDPGYMLYDDGTDLTMKIQRTVTLTVIGGGSVDATVIGNTETYGPGVSSIYVPDGIGLDLVSVGNATYAFSRWISATNSMNSLIDAVSVSSVTADLAVTAVFVTGGFTLSVNLNGEGSVAVTITNTAAGTSAYTITANTVIPIASGDSISMTATGSAFSRWVSAATDLNSLSNNVSTTATGNMTATAVFVPGALTLTANISGTGSVAVTITNASGSSVYTITVNTVIPIASGDSISMTATGSTFSRWISATGSLNSLGNAVSVSSVSGSLIATAVFVPGSLTLTANISGSGSVAVTITNASGSSAYTVTAARTVIPIASGDSISMTATGSTFSRWVSETSDLNSLGSNVSTTASSSLIATAVFVTGGYTLNANINGTGSVAVTINSATYTIAANTVIPIAANDIISMTATGSTFSRWISGTASLHSLDSTVSATATGSLVATAVFVTGSLTLVTDINGTGSIAVTITDPALGNSVYTIPYGTEIPIASGDSISMTAIGTGSTFSRWISETADLNSLSSTVSATATGNITAIAVFVTGSLTLTVNLNGSGSVDVTISADAGSSTYTIEANTVIPITSGDGISMTATGSTFSRWVSGTSDLNSLSNNVSTTAFGSLTATAVFVTGSLTLTANISGSGSVDVTITDATAGGSTYTVTPGTPIPIAYGDSISMTATGTDGYTFSRWISDTTDMNSLSGTVSATASDSLTATAFFVTGGYTMNVNINGTGSVDVTINSDVYTITANTVIPIASGDSIEMTAAGTGGYTFSRWVSSESSVHSLSNSVSITASGSFTASAVFVNDGFTLSANVDGTGSVGVMINGAAYAITSDTVIPAASGDVIFMNATGTGSTFSRWVSGTADLNSLSSNVFTTVSGSMTATAVFVTGGLSLITGIDGTGSVNVTINGAVYTQSSGALIPVASGDSISMTATGSTFSRWVSPTGSLNSLNSTVSATVSGNLAATAVFVNDGFTLNADISGTGSVNVTINGATYTITESTSIPVASRDSIIMAATGTSGYTFSRWVSGTASLNSLVNNVSATVSGDLEATAVFVNDGYALTVNFVGTGSVAVTISNAASGSSTYTMTPGAPIPVASGDSISMTATGTSGYTFSRWISTTADLHSLSSTVSTTVSGSLTATVVSVLGSLTLTANISGTGSVTVTISNPAAGDSAYTITPGTPIPIALNDSIEMTAAGDAFSRWISETEDLNSFISTVTTTAADSITATAVFAVGGSALTANVSGTGSVVVTITNASLGDSTYTITINTVILLEWNAAVSLTAVETDTDYAFSRWEGDGAALSEDTSVTMRGPRTSTAVFVDIATPDKAYDLTVNILGNGTVTVTINDTYDYTLFGDTIIPMENGALVVLAAAADTDYTFSRWDGDGVTLSPMTTPATMNAPMTSTAVFVNTVSSFSLSVNITGSGTVSATINSSNYNLTGNTVIQVEEGADVSLTAVNWSDTFSRWVFSDPSLNSFDFTVPVGPVSSNITATAIFVDRGTPGASYELTMNITGGGTGTVTAVIAGNSYAITALIPVYVESGARVSFTANPGSNSMFAFWMIGPDATDAARADGSPAPPSGTMPMNGDMYVEATFVSDDATFTITLSIDPDDSAAAVEYSTDGGTTKTPILSGESADVTAGGNVIFYFAPETSYHIVGVNIDGQYTDWTSTGYTLTFTRVVSDHDLIATFENGPLIYAEAGDNGSITPNGNFVLGDYGYDQTFTITANKYYTVGTVTISQGSDVQTGGVELLTWVSDGVWTYTFSDVQEQYNSIVVAFRIADGVSAVTVTAGTSSTAGNIDVTRADDGAVIMIPAGTTAVIPVPTGTYIMIHADPSPSFLFTYWTINDGGTITNPSASSYKITADNDMAVGTEFVQNTGTFSTMNVSSSAGGSVSWYYTDGTVTVTGGTGTFNIPNNADVTFNAILDPETASDHVFSRWTGDLRSLLEEDVFSPAVSASAAFSVNALFLALADSFDLTVNIEGSGTVSATIDGIEYELTEETTVIWVEKDASVGLAASDADPYNPFSRWQGDGAALSLTTSVTMTAPMVSKAVFVDLETAGASFYLTVFITGMGKVTVTIYGSDYILTSTTTIPLEANVLVDLEAAETEPDYAFSRWEMDGAALSPATSVKMDDRRDAMAVFVDTITPGESFELTVNITGSGEVVANINGNNYTLTASSTVIPVEAGTSIELKAGSADGTFSRWVSATSSLNQLDDTVSVGSVSSDLTATAVFVTGGSMLSVNVDGVGSVAVTISNADSGSSTYTTTVNTAILVASGDSISMTATGTGASAFSRWVSATGSLHSLDNSVSETITDSGLTATAVFVIGGYTLTANLSGSGYLDLTINDDTYRITTDKAVPVTPGDSISMTATGTGSTFSRWVSETGSLHSLGSTVSTTASGSLTATAFFVAGGYTLTANIDGTGSVAVTVNGAAYTITAGRAIPIASGDSISMTAVETGSTFSRWVSGTADLHSLGSTVSTTASGSLTATAFFVAGGYTLTVNIDGTGSVAVTINSAVYTITYDTEIPIASGDSVSMVATGAGNTFSRWVSGTKTLNSLSNSVSATEPGSLVATAVFVTGTLTLTASINGTGSVEMNISSTTLGDSIYTITASTTIPVASGDWISMTAAGTAFSRWVSSTASLHSLSSTVSETVSGSLTATAFFVAGSYTLSANIEGTGSVAVTINSAVYTITSDTEIPIASGDSISMTATGSVFSRWVSATGSLHSLNSTVSETASGSLTATAVFVTGTLTLTANLNGSGSVAVTINSDVHMITTSTEIPIASGDVISMTASGTGSFAFSRWVSATEDLHSLRNNVSTTALGNLTATAFFVTGGLTLTVNVSGSGSVEITINNAVLGSSVYTTPANRVIPITSGDVISMTATATGSYAFSRWVSETTDLHSLSSIVTTTVSGSLTATVFFVTGGYTLAANLDGTGSLAVTINGAAYTMTISTEIPITSGDPISISATATGGSTFSRWISETADLNSLGNIVTITASGDLTATAVFVTGGYTLAANLDGTGSVAVTITNASGISTYSITADTVIPIASDDSISMTATATGGSTFSRWVSVTEDLHSLGSTVSAPASIGMSATAFFITGGHTLSAILNGTGSVAVMISGAVYTITDNTAIPIAPGDSISMTATAAGGSVFSRWVSNATADLNSLDDTVSTTASGSLVATAFFVTGGHTLTANLNGTGSLAVTINGTAYTVTVNTVIPIASGDSVSMTASGTGGYTFSRWVSSTASLHSIGSNVSTTASGSLTATAFFVPTASSHAVSFTVTGPGTVTMTIGGAQYTYGAGTYSTKADDGTTVGFSAAAGSGSVFSRWVGSMNIITPTIPAAALTDDVTLNAIFLPVASSYAITLGMQGTGTVTMTIGGVPFVFASGAAVTVESNIEVGLSASAGTGYAFSRWEGDGASLSETTSVFMNNNMASTVVFVDTAPGESFELTVSINGGGTALMVIDGNSYTLTAQETVIRLEKGITVELGYLPPVVAFSAFMAPAGGFAAAAVPDHSFSRWEGDGASLSKTISVTMDAPRTSTLVLVDATPGASFELTVNVEGTGSVTVTINGNVYVLEESTTILLEKDMVVSLEADVTDAEHEFSRWEGDGASLSGTITMTMNADMTSTVVFVDTEETGASFVTVNISGNGEVVVTINGNDYTLTAASTKVWLEEEATSLTFKAVNTSGSFSHWADNSGVVYTVGTHSADVSDGYSITAYFYAGSGDGSYKITLNVEGEGTVDVTFTDQDENVVTLTNVSGLVIVHGTTVTFTANDGTGSFLQWTDIDGAVLSTDASFTVEIEKDLTITANFASTPSSGGFDPLMPVIIIAALAAIGVIAFFVLKAVKKKQT